MQNNDLAKDYINRAAGRLLALDTLYVEKLWADVVRESQEVVDLALKGLLRFVGSDVPRIHNVSEALIQNADRLPTVIRESLEHICEISADLRRDRELAFYGSEDLTPLNFYKEKHALSARDKARRVVRLVREGAEI